MCTILHYFLGGVLRLVNSNNTSRLPSCGRLEIFLNGRWGTISSSNFNSKAAKVACKQLGFADQEKYGSMYEFG